MLCKGVENCALEFFRPNTWLEDRTSDIISRMIKRPDRQSLFSILDISRGGGKLSDLASGNLPKISHAFYDVFFNPLSRNTLLNK